MIIIIDIIIRILTDTNNFIELPKKIIHNKKIVLCISGILSEEYITTLKTIKKYIIDIYDTDVFYNFDKSNNYDINIINNILNPKMYEYKDYDNKMKISNNFNKNYFNMCARLIDCNNLKIEYEKKNNFSYDIVIRIRPDIYFKDSLNILNIKDDTIYMHQTLYLPIINGTLFGVCDQYFYCTNNIANKLLNNNLFNSINNIDKNCLYNEYIFYYYIKSYNLKIEKVYSSSLLYKLCNFNLYKLIKYLYEKKFNLLCFL
jgi:hypothetical protein